VEEAQYLERQQDRLELIVLDDSWDMNMILGLEEAEEHLHNEDNIRNQEHKRLESELFLVDFFCFFECNRQ